MPVSVLLEVKVKPEHLDDFTGAAKGAFPDTRAFDGNLEIYAVQNQDETNTFVLVEKWESKAHHQKYLAWRTETGFMEKLGALLAGPPSIRYFDIVDA